MENNVYIYSNSTRNQNRTFNNYQPAENGIHVFLNDAYALYSNYKLFENITRKIMIFSFDNWQYIGHLQQMFIHNEKFEKIITCSTSQWCDVDVNTYTYLSVNGKINNSFNGKRINLTTGARAVQICQQVFPNIKIYLVNFGDPNDIYHTDELKKKDEKNNGHNWSIEKQILSTFEHIYI